MRKSYEPLKKQSYDPLLKRKIPILSKLNKIYHGMGIYEQFLRVSSAPHALTRLWPMILKRRINSDNNLLKQSKRQPQKVIRQYYNVCEVKAYIINGWLRIFVVKSKKWLSQTKITITISHLPQKKIVIHQRTIFSTIHPNEIH